MSNSNRYVGKLGRNAPLAARYVGKFGRKAPRRDARTLQLSNYVGHALLPAVPAHFDWSRAVEEWPVMLNDQLGDCTCACCGHMVQCWSANAGSEVVLPDNDILALYEAVSGYDPTTHQNDDGAVELDVLNYWRNQGVAGHRISAYVALEPGNHAHMQIATFLFGGVYTGIALPKTIQTQDVWAVPPGGPTGDGEPGSLGGHAVPIVSYDPLGVACVTWGRLQRMTWSFVDVYLEEAYALLSPDWFEGKRLAPSGFDIAALTEDLSDLQSTNPPKPWPVAKSNKRA